MATSFIIKDKFPEKGNWTEEQTQLAFYFYCQTSFGQLHSRNPKVKELAHLIERTPDALAMKCCNIASLDPAHQARGVAGLGNASKLDQLVWDEFHANWEALTSRCENLLETLRHEHSMPSAPLGQSGEEEISSDYTGEVRKVIVAQRIKQAFFRKAVLSGYKNRCCITGISDTRLLVASHIVPWREDASIRLHPGNGLCLSALHDKAFDNFLFSLSDGYRIILSEQMKKTKDEFLSKTFHPLENCTIELPERFLPDLSFLQRHRQKMFDLSS